MTFRKKPVRTDLSTVVSPILWPLLSPPLILLPSSAEKEYSELVSIFEHMELDILIFALKTAQINTTQFAKS